MFGFLLAWFVVKGLPLEKGKLIKFPIILFVLSLLASLVFSYNKITSLKEVYKYIISILLFSSIISVSGEEKNKVIKCMVLASLIISVFAIYQYFFGFQHILDYIAKNKITDPFILDYVNVKRVFFPFVTPNVLGGYLAMMIPLTFTYKNRVWLVIPLSLALLLTRSLGGLLSLFAGLMIYFYCLKTSLRAPKGRSNLFFEKRNLFLLMGISVIIGLVFISRVTIQKQHLQPAFSTMMRLNYWKDTWEIIKVSPLTGVGLGNFNLAESRYAHNSYLQIWAEMGILGVISFFWLVMAVIKKNKTAALLAANSAFLVHNLVDFTFFLPEVAMIWWVILGLSVSKNNE